MDRPGKWVWSLRNFTEHAVVAGGGGLSQPVRGGWGQTSLKSTRTRETISNLLTPSAPNMQTFYLWNMVYEFGMGTAIGIYSKCYEGL